jgi:hypothetical protein
VIPPILHQQWRDAAPPARFAAWQASWQRLGAKWQRRLWTDATLDAFVAEHYPHFLPIYRGYPLPIMRADAARYLLLERFGGLYADLDCECLRDFDSLLSENRVVLAEEPASHAAAALAASRALPRLLSNALMLSPPGHPFWATVHRLLVANAGARGPLDATGPFLLSGAWEGFAAKERLLILPAKSVSPVDRDGHPVAGDAPVLAQHHWAGTWMQPVPRLSRLKRWRRERRARRALAAAPGMTPAEARAGVDARVLACAAPAGGRVAILAPVREAAASLPALLAAIGRLQHPAAALDLAFLVAEGQDGSLAILRQWQAAEGARYRSLSIIEEPPRYAPIVPRWEPALQRRRRAGIAAARNRLIAEALGEAGGDVDWVLWLDADMVALPADLLQRLFAAKGRIVTPNCVRRPGGPSFDLNSYIEEAPPSLLQLGRYLVDGLYQPPAGLSRVYLSELRYRERVRLHSVGGTVLLVDAALHRAGLGFPEQPYRQLIETEAFARLASELGMESVGLPRLEVLHAENG